MTKIAKLGLKPIWYNKKYCDVIARISIENIPALQSEKIVLYGNNNEMLGKVECYSNREIESKFRELNGKIVRFRAKIEYGKTFREFIPHLTPKTILEII